ATAVAALSRPADGASAQSATTAAGSAGVAGIIRTAPAGLFPALALAAMRAAGIEWRATAATARAVTTLYSARLVAPLRCNSAVSTVVTAGIYRGANSASRPPAGIGVGRVATASASAQPVPAPARCLARTADPELAAGRGTALGGSADQRCGGCGRITPRLLSAGSGGRQPGDDSA